MKYETLKNRLANNDKEYQTSSTLHEFREYEYYALFPNNIELGLFRQYQLTIYPKCLSGYRLEQEYRSLAQHIDIVTSLNFVGGLKPNVITIGFDGAMFANWRDFVASDILKNKYCLAQETHYQALAS